MNRRHVAAFLSLIAASSAQSFDNIFSPFISIPEKSMQEQYITPGTANERIAIPEPPVPDIPSERYNCPHDDDEANDLMDWHSTLTWQGFIPVVGDFSLPPNTRVVVRQSVQGTLGVVTIPKSSELIFAENLDGITFDASGIDVQGKLTIGSETCRIETPITITLHGDRPSDAVTKIYPETTKGISVIGTISLHGQRFYRTWTRLASTVQPGDTVILVQNEVNWLPGQEVVLVTTAMKDSREWHRNEIVKVRKVLLNPIPGVIAAVYLESPAIYQHVANSGYQGEVGLLSRTIKIQGNEASEPTDPDPLNCKSSQDIFGDRSIPCPNTELTGYGGHIIVQNGGRGRLEGVELYRMGQTNVMARYPIHFHLLGDCPDCYFRDSSVHRSFYRCVSIHGTHYTQISENVAYDAIGFCYYMEDGVEHHNRIEFNLGAHIHMIGKEPPGGPGLVIAPVVQSNDLTMPADITASAFYITNVQNYVIGNAASGGWAGFAFPHLPSPLGPFRQEKFRPSSVLGLTIDGNTAHSTAWWWQNAGAFYFGGSLYYNDDGILEYNAGRDMDNRRVTCLVDKCKDRTGCNSFCRQWEEAWLQVTNSKSFLVANSGYLSWSGRVELIGYECHDCGISVIAQSDGFWIHNMLNVCRTKTPIALPADVSIFRIRGDGFRWYDTNQEHIITTATFRNCGYRSNEYNQYDQSPDRGCGDDPDTGCISASSVFSFVTHSDQNVPEMMQATKDIVFENCGRRFMQYDFRVNNPTSVSGRSQNWLDDDGSVTGLGERSIIGSGLADAGMWWQADSEAVYDPQGPLWFYKQADGPQRGLGHFTMKWDEALHSQVPESQCGNKANIPCDTVGYIKHLGEMFANDKGLPVTANAQIVGPVGGFGWKLELYGGAPKRIRFSQLEVDPDTPLLISIAYPRGTIFSLAYYAGYCTETPKYLCSSSYYQVESVEAVRMSMGNTFHVDPDGVLTFRIVQTPKTFIGRPDFFLPKYTDDGRNGQGVALERFERDGIRLPMFVDGTYMILRASCLSFDGVYCADNTTAYEPEVCPEGFNQTGYDTCTSSSDTSLKMFADGNTNEVDTSRISELNSDGSSSKRAQVCFGLLAVTSVLFISSF